MKIDGALGAAVRLVTPRNFVIVLWLAILAALLDRYKEAPLARYRQWRYPPQAGIDPKGREILDALEAREKRRVQSEIRRVEGLLARARGHGFEVAELENLLAEAARLNAAQTRTRSLSLIADIEMDIPRPKIQYIPVDAPTEQAAPPQTAEPAPPARPPKAQRRLRRAR